MTAGRGTLRHGGAAVWDNAAMAHSFADITPPIALTPLDGRYRGQVAPLVDHLSEAALNRSRLVEIGRASCRERV